MIGGYLMWTCHETSYI
ncbi:hypothetical protein Goklo_004760 [Gossypium klotzschianum]|uniref:Uncharacterized protein n=1 Tax=Gossypium klotzschianum TaxID=34286 RepID=A0A7J8VPS9_9ROSI|nr:hypothetical protein [Gossypium klotzschianum]